ncbi:hypothetical protein [Psychrobacillus sp. FSL H8-0510]|uniref:hypothetical protein n=1 Tax=Psychrobacillus sp. FSL H8-0510 TaxID=2921394 RepID=UPI0030F6B605
MTGKPYYSVTCFMKEDPSELFPLLLPLHFKHAEKQSLLWRHEQTTFQIVPFSTRGTESRGYRLLFSGSPDSFRYIIDQFLGAFEPSFSGIEWIYQTDFSQNELVKLAEKQGYTRCSMFGLYEQEKVGIVLMQSGVVNCQVRNHGITNRNIASYMQKIEDVSATFQPKTHDLFSYHEEGMKVS